MRSLSWLQAVRNSIYSLENTVESPTRGHFRAAAIVLCSEIVLCWEFDFIIHFLPLTE